MTGIIDVGGAGTIIGAGVIDVVGASFIDIGGAGVVVCAGVINAGGSGVAVTPAHGGDLAAGERVSSCIR